MEINSRGFPESFKYAEILLAWGDGSVVSGGSIFFRWSLQLSFHMHDDGFQGKFLRVLSLPLSALHCPGYLSC